MMKGTWEDHILAGVVWQGEGLHTDAKRCFNGEPRRAITHPAPTGKSMDGGAHRPQSRACKTTPTEPPLTVLLPGQVSRWGGGVEGFLRKIWRVGTRATGRVEKPILESWSPALRQPI